VEEQLQLEIQIQSLVQELKETLKLKTQRQSPLLLVLIATKTATLANGLAARGTNQTPTQPAKARKDQSRQRGVKGRNWVGPLADGAQGVQRSQHPVVAVRSESA
jgi:hypothetical protein